MRRELAQRDQEAQAAKQALESQKAIELQLAELRGMVQQQQGQPRYDLTPETHPVDRTPQGFSPSPAGLPAGTYSTPTQQPPQQWMELQREMLGYDVPQEKLQQLWQAQMQAAGGVTQDQVMQILTRHDQKVAEQGMVGQMLQASYPEFANPQDPFTLRTMELYQQMLNNPALQRIYGQSVIVTDPNSGTQFNAGLVMQAAAAARTEQLQGQQNHQRRMNAPTPGVPQGAARQPQAANPGNLISKGMAELLNHPDFQAVAQRAGLGHNVREVWNTLGPKVSPAVRQSWAQEAQSRGISYTGT